MEPPIGFVRLHDAVDMVGCKLLGNRWRPIGEVVSEIIAVKRKEKPRIDAINAQVRTRAEMHKLMQPDAQIDLEAEAETLIKIQVQTEAQYEATMLPEVERAITMIAEGCEAGDISAAYRSITGADSLDPAVWRMPHWRNFFADGEIDLDLPLLVNGRPNANGDTVRCTREIFIRRSDLDRFIAALSAPKGSPAGRANKRQIASIVTSYRQSLSGDTTPSIPDLERFAKNNGLTGHRDELRAAYHEQFPSQRVGRPSK